MDDFFIFESMDQNKARYYCKEWHLYVEEVNIKSDKDIRGALIANHRDALLSHMKDRPCYEDFVVVDSNDVAHYFSIERKPKLIGKAPLIRTTKGVLFPTKEEYWGPPLPRLSETSKTMGEA